MITCSSAGFQSRHRARERRTEGRGGVSTCPERLCSRLCCLCTSPRSTARAWSGDLWSESTELAKGCWKATAWSILALAIGTQACGAFPAKACGRAKLEVFKKKKGGWEDAIFLVRTVRTSKQNMENSFTTVKAAISPTAPFQDSPPQP